MANKNKILRLFLLPLASIIFLAGWCLQFACSTKKDQRKIDNCDIQIRVLESDEQLICQPIEN